MKKFVNRSEELDFLNEEYKKNTSSLIILYGRRRVGKTSLIKEFIKDKDAIYYLATEENLSINRSAFKDKVSDFLKDPLLKEANLERWEPIFERIVSSEKKAVLILDEFQYLGNNDPGFLSVFQKIWDEILSTQNIMVILCGSLIHMMIEQTLSYSSPLYGRRTGQIKLKQIKFQSYKDFFKEMSHKELIEYYSITGGIPKYIEMINENQNILENIKNKMLNTSSLLYEEPFFLLNKEVSNLGNYFSILRAIAFGNHKLGNISSFLGIKQTSLTRYLKVLMDMDIIEREVPVTEKNPEKSKRGLYVIKDNYLKFWFRFIYPYRDMIEEGRINQVLKEIESNFIDNHVSFVYENICKDTLFNFKSLKHPILELDAIGRWWDNESEIDIIGLDHSQKNIVFCECKYWQKKVGISVLKELAEKAKKVEWHNHTRNEKYVLFSINGYTDDLIAYAQSKDNIFLLE
ncbi:MAG: ATP-binding protein [Clostridia bacterium]|nr:ATP-binding protein [Clostridia bacterium]